MTSHSHADTLARIHSALQAARQVFSRFTAGAIEAEYKIGHDPVTEADRAVDAVLRTHKEVGEYNQTIYTSPR